MIEIVFIILIINIVYANSLKIVIENEYKLWIENNTILMI